MPNTFDMDAVKIDLGAKRNARQDRQLMGGVHAINIETRIGFRIAQLLSVRQNVCKGAAGLPHRR